MNGSCGSFSNPTSNYYHKVRPHRSLAHDSPIPRPVESPDRGKVIEMPLVGGLHHHYLRQAA